MKFLSSLPLFLGVTLSENDKRLILVIFLAIIIILLLIGAIGYVIQKVMVYQARKLDKKVSEAVTFGVITEENHFKRYARRKNLQMFLVQAWLPLLIIILGCGVLVVRAIMTGTWNYNPFSMKEGFGTLLWFWDFENPIYYSDFFGITILNKWPATLNNPHINPDAWAGYASVPCFIIGGVWYLIVVQGFFARWLRTKKILMTTFSIDLTTYNVNTGFTNPATPVPPAAPINPVNPENK